MNRNFISEALARRLAEVRARIGQLRPSSFAETADFVSRVQATLSAPLTSSAAIPANSWMQADGDCLGSLRRLSLGEAIATRPVTHPPVEDFLEELTQSIKQRRPVFDLLVQRYAHAPNFLLPGENEVREFLLMRLMTADRERVESGSLESIDAGDLLLRLNLIALTAQSANDLRFLDALNYYYDLLPAQWRPQAENGWLLASCLALYARALMSWS